MKEDQKESDDKTVFAEVKFRFPEKIKIFQEVESYQFLDLVADLGGYLGLTLGLSLLDIAGPVDNIITTTAGYFGRFFVIQPHQK